MALNGSSPPALAGSPKGVTTINTILPGEGSVWDEPIPFDVYDLPAFPVSTLPAWMAEWAAAQANYLQTPVDVQAMVGLAILSTVAAKRVEVRARDGWIEPANLYLVVSLPSGEKKSPTFRAAVEPLKQYEIDMEKEHRDTFASQKAAYEIAHMAAEKSKAEAAKPGLDPTERAQKRDEAEKLARDFAAMRKPVYPRLTADDVTTEKLASLLSDHKGRIAILSSEGGFFDILSGRYSEGVPSLDTVLKAHSGDPIEVDRETRQGGRVRKPALTIGLTIQPDVLTGLSDTKAFRGRGLLARFLYCLPVSRIGDRDVDPDPPSPTVGENYRTHVQAILRLPEQDDAAGEPVPLVVGLEPEAYEVFCDFQRQIEGMLKENGELAHMRDWANKLPGHVLRLGGLLHLADHVSWTGAAIPQNITAAIILRAIAIADYLIAHAKAAYGEIGAQPGVKEGKRIAEWLRRDDIDRFTRTDVYRAMRGHLRRGKDLDAPLAYLESLAYIRDVQPDGERKAGRPPKGYEVNPRWKNGVNGDNRRPSESRHKSHSSGGNGSPVHEVGMTIAGQDMPGGDSR